MGMVCFSENRPLKMSTTSPGSHCVRQVWLTPVTKAAGSPHCVSPPEPTIAQSGSKQSGEVNKVCLMALFTFLLSSLLSSSRSFCPLTDTPTMLGPHQLVPTSLLPGSGPCSKRASSSYLPTKSLFPCPLSQGSSPDLLIY